MAVREGELFLYWADKGVGSHYRPESLSAADVVRAGRARRPKAEQEWQVSRALLQAVRDAHGEERALSLSHSGGHALCACAPKQWSVGADLEALRPRDFAGLAEWICSAEEKNALYALAGSEQRQHFYLLWTLKEAFIKAAGLAFPADMATVGLSGKRLRAPIGAWQAMSWRLGEDWIVSVVWQGSDATAHWRAVFDCTLPSHVLLGRWSSSCASSDARGQ